MKASVLRCPSCSREQRGKKIRSKKFEKDRKKFLTNGIECDIIQKLPFGSASVPCKLNNVKTIFNTLDN